MIEGNQPTLPVVSAAVRAQSRTQRRSRWGRLDRRVDSGIPARRCWPLAGSLTVCWSGCVSRSGGACQCGYFAQGDVPREGGDALVARSGRVGLPTVSLPEDDPHSLGPQFGHGAAEGHAGGEGGVDERHNDGGDAAADRLGDGGQGVVVGDARGELAHGVERGRGDDDAGQRGQGPGRGGGCLTCLGANRMAEGLLECVQVEEVGRCWCGDESTAQPLPWASAIRLVTCGAGSAAQTTTVSVCPAKVGLTGRPRRGGRAGPCVVAGVVVPAGQGRR
jgi:hypothetical protein